MYLKLINSHRPCQDYIQRYLEKNDRALAIDTANIPRERDRVAWAAAMDEARAAHGNDKPWRGKQPVTFLHAIISPDPRDEVDLATLREVAMEWAHHFFGKDCCEKGACGGYFQVAAVYHDDNRERTAEGEEGIPHAHLVINTTNLLDGKRLHLDRRTNELALANYLQELAKQRGLTYYSNPETLQEKWDQKREAREGIRARSTLLKDGREVAPAEQGKRCFTKHEKAILRGGKYSWKQDLCNMVQTARRISTDEASLLEALEKLGVGVRDSGGDWVFSHPGDPQRWCASGHKLGPAYTRDALLDSITWDGEAGCPRIPEVRERVLMSLMIAPQVKFELVAIVQRGTDVHDVARALRINDRYGVRCHADYQRLITLYEVRLNQVSDEDEVREIQGRLDEIRFAQACSERGDYFLGVPDTGEMPTPPEAPESRGAPRAGDSAARSSRRRRDDDIDSPYTVGWASEQDGPRTQEPHFGGAYQGVNRPKPR